VFEVSKEDVRFGVALPFSSIPVAELLDMAMVNEEAGFNSVWSGDGLVYFPPSTIPEAWTILTAAAVSTKKVLLGTCVTDPHRYHLAVLAQRLATIDQLFDGRVILGLGAGMAMNLEPFGIRWNKPVSRLAEAVKIMRRLWAGEKFSYDGEFWKFKDVVPTD
jgi:alkanesulfonate monooxygenase SsuD/methylene tetrahydromethanopterin reductase-like flavin-dependent oxidoreductase (luciferase family)